jgi:hypothetical protein
LCVALTGLWPATAQGGDPDAANALLRKGADLFKQQDYEGARETFALAYEVDANAGTLFNLALSELHAGHPVEATTHLREYLTHAQEPPAKLESARTKWLPRAEARTARLVLRAPTGAELAVDGIVQPRVASDSLGDDPAPILVAAGEHDLLLRQGTLAQLKHIVARGGELVEVTFPPLADAASGPASGEGPGVASGPGRSESAQTTAPRAKWITVVALGLGAVALSAVGTGFAIDAQANATDLDAIRAGGWTTSSCWGPNAGAGSCSQMKSDVEANRRDWMVSIAAYAGAGLLAGGAAIALTLWPGGEPTHVGLRLGPSVADGATGLVLGGRW